MAIRNRVSIVECIPKNEELEEGKIIHEYLKMLDRYTTAENYEGEPWRVTTLDDYYDAIIGNQERYIHISCHGDDDDYGNYHIQLPKGGRIYPNHLNKHEGFWNRVCLLSGCNLGEANFCEELFKYAGPKIIIAPIEEIYFIDAVTFWILFYYYLFNKGKSPEESFKFAEKKLGFKDKMVLLRR